MFNVVKKIIKIFLYLGCTLKCMLSRHTSFACSIENIDSEYMDIRIKFNVRPCLCSPGTMSSVDSHQLPDAKGRTALTRKLLGITEEQRQLRRDQILSTSVEDYHKFADYVECIRKDCAKVVAVTSHAAADKVLQEKPGFWDIEIVQ